MGQLNETPIGSLIKIIAIHASATADSVLAASADPRVCGHVLPTTGEYSHAAWAVNYLDSTGVSLDDHLPIGAMGVLDPVGGSIEIGGDSPSGLVELVAEGEQLLSRDTFDARLEVRAQLARSQDVVTALAEGATGVGEVKAEILVPDASGHDPVLSELEGIPWWGSIPLRFFDVTLDKGQTPKVGHTPASSLGMRGVRLLSEHGGILDSYLRLIPPSLMDRVTCILPMVVSAEEVVGVRTLLRGRLDRVGSLIETPAACMEVWKIAQVSDQVLLGMNDLCQYIYAWDRNLPSPHMTAHELDSVLFRQLRSVASTCRMQEVECGFPIDVPPTSRIIEQVVEIAPDFIAVPPKRVRLWQRALQG
jgi:hypothetical protein